MRDLITLLGYPIGSNHSVNFEIDKLFADVAPSFVYGDTYEFGKQDESWGVYTTANEAKAVAKKIAEDFANALKKMCLNGNVSVSIDFSKMPEFTDGTFIIKTALMPAIVTTSIGAFNTVVSNRFWTYSGNCYTISLTFASTGSGTENKPIVYFDVRKRT